MQYLYYTKVKEIGVKEKCVLYTNPKFFFSSKAQAHKTPHRSRHRKKVVFPYEDVPTGSFIFTTPSLGTYILPPHVLGHTIHHSGTGVSAAQVWRSDLPGLPQDCAAGTGIRFQL